MSAHGSVAAPMRVLAASLLVLGSLLQGCAPSPRQTPITAEVVGAGEVVVQHEGAQQAPATLQGSVSTVSAIWNPTFIAPPDRVQARLGNSIGIEVLVRGAEYLTVLPVRTRVTHPRITDPGSGRTSETDEWDSPMNAGVPRFAGWSFDHPWELVPGTWRIEVLLGPRTLAAQTFQVSVDPR